MRKLFRLVTRGLVLTAAAAIIALGISCEKGLLTNTDYTTGSSATKDIADSSKDELSSLMHQQAQTLPAPTPSGVGLTAQKSIITTSALNPDLPFTVVPLDEFGRYTDTIKANIDDVVYIELQGVLTGYYNGAILVKATGADIISIEESYDYWWNGIGLWWTPASADTTKGGAGTLYNYKHIHSPVSDTYKSEGSSWCAAWEAEANQYGYPYGPAGSLVTGTAPSEARFYFSGYLGNHSATRPGLRLGLRLKDSSAVVINITGHNRYEFSWLSLSPVYTGTISVTPRGNYQSVHSEGENCWIQLSYPESAYVGDTITVTAYGELMMDANEYSASVESIDSDGAVITLTNTGVVSGNTFGPVSFSVDITHASIWKTRIKIKSLGSHPGGIIFADGNTTVSVLTDRTPPKTIIKPALNLNNYDCTTATSLTVILEAEDQPDLTEPRRPISGVDYINYEILTGTNRASQGVVTTTGTTVTITLSEEGRYELKYRAVDKANPPNKEDPWNTQIIIIDYTKPVVSPQEIFSPGNTTQIAGIPGQTFATKSTSITITKTVSDTSGAAEVEVGFIGVDAQGNTVTATRTAIPTVISKTGNNETIRVTVNLPAGMADGEFDIIESVIDKAGNTSNYRPFSALLDRVPPTITATPNSQPDFTTPLGVKWYNAQTTGPIIITLTARDDPPPTPPSGILSLVPPLNPPKLTFSEKNKVFSHTYRAMDNAENISTPITVEVNIDKDPPEVPNNITIITNTAVSYAQVVAQLRAKITDKTGGSGVDWGSVSYSGIPAGGILYGSRNVKVTITAKDKANNNMANEINVSVLDREPGK